MKRSTLGNFTIEQGPSFPSVSYDGITISTDFDFYEGKALIGQITYINKESGEGSFNKPTEYQPSMKFAVKMFIKKMIGAK